MFRAAIVSTTLVILLALSGCSEPPRHNATNVLLIVLDTVRADRLSCYGYGRPTTPNIDEIAKRGVRFENVYSNSSWTLAAHASLFTGLYGAAHRATQETLKLSDGPVTLAEIFDSAGYQTFGVSANGVVSKSSGLARGFESFVEVFRKDFRKEMAEEGERGHLNNIAFKRFLSSSSREEPFFAFINYIAAHAPYSPEEPHRSRFLDADLDAETVAQAERLRMPDHYMDGAITEDDFKILGQLYDGEINFLDRYIADLLETLERDGRFGKTLVIITSDHGENIGDHGHFAHVFNIYNTLLKIPLIVLVPGGGQGGEVRTDTAQLLDLFPTILRQCGISHKAPAAGRDLFADGAASKKTVVIAEYYYPRQVLSVFDADKIADNSERFLPFMRRLRAIQDGEMKLIAGSDGSHELYDLAKDPGESEDLLGTTPEHPAKDRLLQELNDMLETQHGDEPLPPPPPVGWMVPGFEEQIDDPEVLKRLRALGYIK